MVLPSVSFQMLLFLIRVADFSTDAVLRVGGLSAFKDAVIKKAHVPYGKGGLVYVYHISPSVRPNVSEMVFVSFRERLR